MTIHKLELNRLTFHVSLTDKSLKNLHTAKKIQSNVRTAQVPYTAKIFMSANLRCEMSQGENSQTRRVVANFLLQYVIIWWFCKLVIS